MRQFTTGIRKLQHPVNVKTSKDLVPVLSEFSDAHVEVLTVIPVDKDLVASEVYVCAVGSMMSVSVEARTIFSETVRRNRGDSLIVAHNHPFQKTPVPSKGDVEFVRGIKSSGVIIDVPVIDSIVVGSKGQYSFRDHSLVFEKGNSYVVPKIEAHKNMSMGTVPVEDRKVQTSKHAYEVLRFLKKDEKMVVGVMHLTPDLEMCGLQVFEDDRSMGAKAFAKMILRSILENPATKYFVMAYNCGVSRKRAQFEMDMNDILTYIRLGSTLLCVPLMDVLVLESSDYYSFMEHGRVVPRARSYDTGDMEGLRLKGSRINARPEVPPYSWSFR